jgi:tetratricopeptide (TPR) repeat protein
MKGSPVLCCNASGFFIMKGMHGKTDTGDRHAMLQQESERLVLVPWTCGTALPQLTALVDVIQFLLGLYCSVWQSAAQPNLLKNVARTLQNRWDKHIPVTRLGNVGEELLAEITTLHRARYLLTGHIELVQNPHRPGMVHSIQVQVMLYDSLAKRWALNHTFNITYFEPGRNHMENFAPATWGMEELMRSISLHLIAFISPEAAYMRMTDLASFRLNSTYDTLTRMALVDKLPTASSRTEGYEHLAHEEPENNLIQLHLGRQLKLNRRYVQASKALGKGVSSPHFPKRMRAQILNELGSCVALSGESEQAIDHWINAIEEDPTHVLAYMNIAHAYEELQQESKAEYYLKEVLNYSPGDTRVYHALARLYSCQDMWDKALAQYQLQLLLDPSDPWCHNNIATCSLQQERLDIAKKHFERAQLLDPQGEAGQYAALVLAGMGSSNSR